MTDLAAWLLQQVAEREQVADEIHRQGCGAYMWPCALPCDCGEPARVLAECAARRAIVDMHRVTHIECPEEPGGDRPNDDYWEPCRTLLLLAQPYAARPGFDPSWRRDHHAG